ncbi:MAG: BatD family protein [Chlamydiota bacterium]|nr:BatD family protein [Chlamydiota bacterium]
MRLVKINSLLIMAAFLINVHVFIYAEQAQIECTLDRTSVLLGDNIILTVSAKNITNPEAPELPHIDNFNVQFRGARQEAYSSLTLIVQGKTVEKRSSGGGYMFDYVLIPQKTGHFYIPPMNITISGKDYITKALEIDVLNQAEKSDDVFLEVHVNKNELFLGEKMCVDLKWYLQKDITAYRLNIPWVSGLKNFLIEDVDLDKSKNYQRVIVNGDEQVIAEKKQEFYNGQKYVVIHIQKILTPIATGKYILDPVFLKCNVVTGYKNARSYNSSFDFFESDMNDFFGMGRQAVTKPFSTRTDALEILVREVPRVGRTENYTGAVGQFDFSLEPSSINVKAGEPITLTMKVSGTGNFDQVQLPLIPEMENFRSYEPESKTQTRQEEGITKGEKIFEKVLVPTTEGTYTLPKISFEYFDPSMKQYQNKTCRSITFNVTKGETPEKDIPVLTVGDHEPERQKGNEIKILKKDIRYIKTTLGLLKEKNKSFEFIGYVLSGILILPLCFLLLLSISHRKKKRLRNDTAYARQHMAMRNALLNFHQAKKSARNHQIDEYHDLVSKTFHGYFCDKFNLPQGSVYTEIIQKLEQTTISPEILKKITSTFEYFDLVRFSAMNTDKLKMQEQLHEIELIIQISEKELR